MSKAKKRTPFWWAAIKDARREGGFSDAVNDRAENWVTCACGKQDPAIPRSSKGAPLDETLFVLGCEFGEAVFDNRMATAARVLRKIEARAAEVLAA